MPKHLVFGNEPFLVDKMRNRLRSEVKTPEFNLLETDEFTDVEIRFLNQYPMLGDRKVLIFNAHGMKECEAVVDYLDEMNSDNVHTYLFVDEVDRRTKLFKRFLKGEVEEYNKVSREMLEKTILQYIKKKGCEIKSDAYTLFLQLINYESEETNLYDVIHALENICSSKEITAEVVEKAVVDRETENIFLLIRLISEGKNKELFHQAELILRQNSGNIIGVLSLVLRNYRIAYKMQVCNCTLADLGVNPRTYIPKLSAELCSRAMDILDDTIARIKTGFYSQDIGLTIALGKLCTLQKE